MSVCVYSKLRLEPCKYFWSIRMLRMNFEHRCSKIVKWTRRAVRILFISTGTQILECSNYIHRTFIRIALNIQIQKCSAGSPKCVLNVKKNVKECQRKTKEKILVASSYTSMTDSCIHLLIQSDHRVHARKLPHVHRNGNCCIRYSLSWSHVHFTEITLTRFFLLFFCVAIVLSTFERGLLKLTRKDKIDSK